MTDLLKGVSRSFYWTMRVLPRDVRPQISLAYLLARATDTIADTALVPVAERLDALNTLRARIAGESAASVNFSKLAENQGLPAERMLLQRIEEALSILPKFSYSDQQRIREVLRVITSGQELDLQRFAGASERNLVALAGDDDLDDYIFRVAGCVGEFWTRLCRAHLFPQAQLNEAEFLAKGVCFGKGARVRVARSHRLADAAPLPRGEHPRSKPAREDQPRRTARHRCALGAAVSVAVRVAPARHSVTMRVRAAQDTPSPFHPN
ncbi:MAG: squalene/phytoene synthase family protein [Verrucomicrobia bacterium]|nr:squalene/phytoene synthase family protein [Verrucomicrobiota bacterium]